MKKDTRNKRYSVEDEFNDDIMAILAENDSQDWLDSLESPDDEDNPNKEQKQEGDDDSTKDDDSRK